MSTAGILIIGNEILSGKVQDENTPFFLRELRAIGVDVRAVHVVPDEIEEIAEQVRAFSRRFDYVLTSGGVGPTHDDLTMDGVARAFGVELVVHDEMAVQLRKALRGAEPNSSQLKMCTLPLGAALISSPDLWFPLVQVRNVFVFPGIPKLLQAKFQSARGCFKGQPWFLRRVYVRCMESDIAQDLHDLLADFPELLLGSYPRTTARSSDSDYLTMLTLESRDEQYMLRAVDSLVARIPSGSLLKVDCTAEASASTGRDPCAQRAAGERSLGKHGQGTRARSEPQASEASGPQDGLRDCARSLEISRATKIAMRLPPIMWLATESCTVTKSPLGRDRTSSTGGDSSPESSRASRSRAICRQAGATSSANAVPSRRSEPQPKSASAAGFTSWIMPVSRLSAM
jgi:molybdenum cofactor synthesis domain-containing protein